MRDRDQHIEAALVAQSPRASLRFSVTEIDNQSYRVVVWDYEQHRQIARETWPTGEADYRTRISELMQTVRTKAVTPWSEA